jgi:hypothetical protein
MTPEDYVPILQRYGVTTIISKYIFTLVFLSIFSLKCRFVFLFSPDGWVTMTPEDYVPILQRYGVTTIIRK